MEWAPSLADSAQLPEATVHPLASDLKAALPAIGQDLVKVVSTPSVWWTVGSGLLAREALDRTGAEDDVTQFFADHTVMPTGLERGFDELGKGYTLLAGAGAWYLIARERNDADAVVHSQVLLRSLSATGLTTLLFKAAMGETRPTGGSGSYPSGHASMTAATATSLWMTGGPKVGVPAAILAGLVDLQRLDSRAHDLDDIVGGATLGWIVAYTLSREEPPTLLGARVLPAFSPSGDPGISLLWSY